MEFFKYFSLTEHIFAVRVTHFIHHSDGFFRMQSIGIQRNVLHGRIYVVVFFLKKCMHRKIRREEEENKMVFFISFTCGEANVSRCLH